MVAKLFATNTKRQEENDPIFRALNQCLNARIYHDRRRPEVDLEGAEVLATLHYPVIVCSNLEKLHRTAIEGVDPRSNANHREFPS